MAVGCYDRAPMVTAHKSYASLVTFILLLLVALCASLNMTAPYLIAVFMGAILALLCYPLYTALVQRFGWGPKKASLVVTLALLVLVVGPVSVFAILAVKQGIVFAQDIADRPDFSATSIIESIGSWGPVQKLVGDPATVLRQIRASIQGGAKDLTTFVLAFMANIPDILLQLVLVLLTCFYFLFQGRAFVRWVSNKIPLDPDVRLRVADSFKYTAVSVIWSSVATATAQSVLVLGTFLLLGIPAAFLAGGAAFIFAWVPVLGSSPVWLAGLLYLWSQAQFVQLIVLVVMGVVTVVVDNVVRVQVLRGRGEMHTLVSLVAIFGGMHMFGLTGVFIGPILVAVLISLLQIWPLVGKRFGLTFEPTIESTIETSAVGDDL